MEFFCIYLILLVLPALLYTGPLLGTATLLVVITSAMATTAVFPFWSACLPQTGISWLFCVIFLVAPAMFANVAALVRYNRISRKRTHKPRHHVLTLALLWFGLALPIGGLLHNHVISDPETNARLYSKPREHIVQLIETGQLKGNVMDCLAQPYFLYLEKPSSRVRSCFDRVLLPEEYKKLSRRGVVEVTNDGHYIAFRFKLYTYDSFDGGSVDVAYVKSVQENAPRSWQVL